VFAVLDQVELGEIFVADGKNLNLETISEQLFGIQTTLNNTLFRIISISSALYFQRPTDLGLQALLTDSIDSMSRTIQTSRYTYSSSNSILSFEAFVSMHVSGSTLLVLFRTGSTLQIHYNFSISVQPSAYISEQVQDFTWTTANQTVLSKQFRFWPQSISNDFAYGILLLIPSCKTFLQNVERFAYIFLGIQHRLEMFVSWRQSTCPTYLANALNSGILLLFTMTRSTMYLMLSRSCRLMTIQSQKFVQCKPYPLS
jgi:hypothetical protein